MLVLQQSALKTCALAPSGNAVAVFAGSSPGAVYDGILSHGGGHVAPDIIGLARAERHTAAAKTAPGAVPAPVSAPRTGAAAVTAAGSISGRKPRVRHRPGDRDIP
jgi:hypothetical protein